MKRRGLGLAEILVVTLLMGIVLQGVGSLVRELSIFSREGSQETRRRVAARLGLEEIGRLARASQILYPVYPSATVQDHLQLSWIVPAYPALPIPEEASAPTGWEPDQPRRNLLVHRVEQRLLLEEGAAKTILAEEVSNFGVLLANNTSLRLTVSWQTKGRVETLQWTTFLPLRAK